MFLSLFSDIITPDWTVYKNQNYGVNNNHLCDLYILNKGYNNPTVVFIHGGGWETGDKSAYEGRAKRYALAGFNVVALNYTLGKNGNKDTYWNVQLQDVQMAIRWLRANAPVFRIDPNRIAAAGDSAGAHLSLFLGSLKYSVPNYHAKYMSYSPSVCAVLNMFGPCDLVDLKDTLINTLSVFDDTPDLAKASPINYITYSSAPTCTIHGLNDTVVPYSQALKLREQFAKYGVKHKLISYDGGHELANIPPLKERWLELQGLYFLYNNV